MNKKFFVQSLLSIIAFLFLFGCAIKDPADLPSFSGTQFDTTMYKSKVDNFIICLDASSSMGDSCRESGFEKFAIAKAISERLNMTIPELGQTAGLRSFGHAESVSENKTELFYGMEKYNSSALAGKLALVNKPGGTSPLGVAVDAMQKDFEGLSGQNAVLLITDGLDMKSGLKEVQDLKAKYGSSLCIYPIQVGVDPDATAFLEEVAKVGECGFLSNAKDLLSGDAMAAFVEKVFLERTGSPAPAPAPATAMKKDSDGDGVYDDQDQCPGTPVGAKVNAVGCWTLDNVLFDYDKSVIKPQAYPLLDEVVMILEKNPAMSIELQGHTDNVGSKEYNMALSMRRSNAVAKYLVNKGILRNRMATTGFGYEKPVALNGTDFGRALNRRVEIHPY